MNESVLSVRNVFQKSIEGLSDPHLDVNRAAIRRLVEGGDRALIELVYSIDTSSNTPLFVHNLLRVFESHSDPAQVGPYCGLLVENLFPLNDEPINARILELINFAGVRMGIDVWIDPDGTRQARAYYFDPEFERDYPFVRRWHPDV